MPVPRTTAEKTARKWRRAWNICSQLTHIVTLALVISSFIILVVIVVGAVEIQHSSALRTLASLGTHAGLVTFLNDLLSDPQVQDALSAVIDDALFGKIAEERGVTLEASKPCAQREQGEICSIISDSCAKMRECAESHDHRKCRDALHDSIATCRSLVPGQAS